jgi:hypothetical protein
MNDYNISLASSGFVSPPLSQFYITIASNTYTSVQLRFYNRYAGNNKYQTSVTGPNNIPSIFIGTVTYTGPNIEGYYTGEYTIPTTLLQNTVYYFISYLLDNSNNIISLAASASTKTTSLFVPNVYFYNDDSIYYENGTDFRVTSNINYRFSVSLDPEIPVGITCKLNYSINGGSTITHTFSPGTLSYNIPTPLIGVGDVSYSLIITDNSNNTVYGSSKTSTYTSFFGFYDLLIGGTLTLNSQTPRLGYSFMAYAFVPGQLMTLISSRGGAWIGRTFRTINFPQRITATGAVTFVAKVYDLSYMEYANPDFSSNNDIITKYTTIYLDPSKFSVRSTSTPVTFTSAGTLTGASVTFAPAITLTSNMVVIFEISSGSGFVQFDAYTSAVDLFNDPVVSPLDTIATGISYSSTNYITNTLTARTHLGVPCKFIY